jgi:hypothetical protein
MAPHRQHRLGILELPELAIALHAKVDDPTNGALDGAASEVLSNVVDRIFSGGVIHGLLRQVFLFRNEFSVLPLRAGQKNWDQLVPIGTSSPDHRTTGTVHAPYVPPLRRQFGVSISWGR